MDPNQTLADLIDAATDGDRKKMIRKCLDLNIWLATDGFAPNLRDVLAILTVKG